MSETEQFLQWLERCGYVHTVELPDGHYAALHVRPYNTQLIVGRIGDYAGYNTAW